MRSDPSRRTKPSAPWPRRKGILVDCGSSSDTSDPGIRRLNNAASKCAMFRSVRFSRPFQMTTASAITPATRIVPMSTESSCRGPRHAPKAPASFQSPAPRLRSEHEGQQQPQAQRRPQQRGFQSRPAVENRVDRDAGRQARYREPVRNPAVAPVENSRGNRHQHRRNPWSKLQRARLKPGPGLNQIAAARQAPPRVSFPYFRAFGVHTQARNRT